MSEQLTYIHQFVPGEGLYHDVTLLLLHGTGGDEHSLRSLGRMILPSAAQLRLRGNVIENGQTRFFRRCAADVADVEDLKCRALDLAAFLQQASAVYGFDLQKLIVAGFSNGANMAAGMLLAYPQPFLAAILLHPMLPFRPETPPDLLARAVFIGAGQGDPLVPVAQTQQLARLLEQAGASVEIFWHNGGHTISVEEVKRTKRWLAGLAFLVAERPGDTRP